MNAVLLISALIGATLIVVIRIGYVLNVRVREARLQAARIADCVADVITALQAKDDVRLTHARSALDNLVVPYYHAGLPYRQSAALDAPIEHHTVDRADREEMLRYRHALEAISLLERDPDSRKIAKRALEEK
jgi:hypothetical protein